ncbi:MAG: sulfate adenylyltransferase subunit CysD, partial [Actinomycetes bacterium]
MTTLAFAPGRTDAAPFEPSVGALDPLAVLESEAVHVFREVVGQLERPALLFSGGKDSIVLLRLAEKA